MSLPAQPISKPEDFVDKDIFEILGLQTIDQKRKDALLDTFTYTITNRTISRLLDQLDEDSQKALEKELESNNQASITAFFEKYNLDYEGFFAEETILYKLELINTVQGGQRES